MKPFVCEFEECGLAFGFKKVLQRHELTHTRPAPPRVRKVVREAGIIDELAGMGVDDTERNINCTVEGCDWRFTREYDLKRHLASFHQRNGEEMDTNNNMADTSDFTNYSVGYGIDIHQASFVF